MGGNVYQYFLIALGVAASCLFGIFLYREVAPEYKIYQNDYITLENFRSTYTHEPPPVFKPGVKQILLERSDKGNPIIDRCTSCHLALEFSHFSPQKLVKDENGQVVFDAKGFPKKEVNKEYVWTKLEQKIAELRDEKVNAQLKEQGDTTALQGRLKEAEGFESLKTAYVSGHTYDVSKVLVMHPLMGKETRPFEFHPIEEYGCTSCHNGNGRGVTTQTAHGPVFDGDYEKEFVGIVPEFTEIDPDNDPRFARVFNGKPGHTLLFQTTPLFVGSLIQAKCAQCHAISSNNLGSKGNKEAFDLMHEIKKHEQEVDFSGQVNAKDEKTIGKMLSDLESLTKNYQRGQELFVAQACYACHRITGFSRGGVGPELTNSGEGYPWYVKESIVWPQADLKTSTMPNFMLDHKELEDLVTYLLGQTGANPSVSQTQYKVDTLAWEAGKKMAWEKPVSPVQMENLRFGMTVFATEGCAACHRLKGFDSNVGFAIEKKESALNFEALEEEHRWFQRLFPEDVTGNDIVKAIDRNVKEIDQRIVDGVRKDSVLDAIETSHPDLIESFYTPFQFANRAKNAYYNSLIELETDLEKRDVLKLKHKEWQSRVHRLMLMYAQEYGLGRLIGPRPNWSGIFRTDQWLMEHFKNPAAHVPRSIMPVFPFDDTKFYALTHMLDVLSVRNRNAIRELWAHEGFDPELAFQTHCSQCHGEFLQGNGPVSLWIYPIPKNLRNAEFLRNLTRERVIDSITHGVKGTPMPPFGEAVPEKPHVDGIPVLSANEIEMLADWLFSSLPGGNVIRGSQDVPKWNYSPEDVIQELEREGNFKRIERGEENRENSSLIASVQPTFSIEEKPSLLFDKANNPHSRTDPEQYYIKKKFYTEENIAQGRAFFELNCAVCHGKAGDGAGARAGTMADAKPRMLNNLDWSRTRDDLRLLRSIKYGVPGTSMTPWGDQTTSFQRLQLVMFIRTLTEEHQEREQLANRLYQAFDEADILIERARSKNYEKWEIAKTQYLKIQNDTKALYQLNDQADASSQILSLYNQEMALLKSIQNMQKQDDIFTSLRTLIKKEKELYNGIGQKLIALDLPQILSDYIAMINLMANRFQVDGFYRYEKQLEVSQQQETLLLNLDREIEKLQSKKETNNVETTMLQERIKRLLNLKETLREVFLKGLELNREEQKLSQELSYAE